MANQLTSAFYGRSGLDSILAGLDGRGVPTQKPMAFKRKAVSKKLAAAGKAQAEPPGQKLKAVVEAAGKAKGVGKAGGKGKAAGKGEAPEACWACL